MRLRDPAAPASLLPLLLAAMLSSCIAPVYVPSPPVAPLFDGAGEVQAAGHYGSHGVDGWVAWSPVDELMVAVAIGGSSDIDDSIHYDRHLAYEAMAGWYAPGESVRIALAGGFGRGDADAGTYDFFLDHARTAQSEYGKLFVQGTLGQVINPAATIDDFTMEAAITLRLSRLGFTGLTIDGRDESGLVAWFTDVSFAYRFGGGPILADFELGLSGQIDPAEFGAAESIDHHPFRLAAGLLVKLR